MAIGLEITKDGVDITNASSPTDYILNTDYPVLKVALEGEDSVTTTSTSTYKDKDLTHNLGYKAQTWVFIDNGVGSSERILAGTDPKNLFSSLDAEVIFFTDKTRLRVRDTSTTGTLNFYYYIFYDQTDII